MKTFRNIFYMVFVLSIIISIAYLALIPGATFQKIIIAVRLGMLAFMSIGLFYVGGMIYITYRTKWKNRTIFIILLLFSIMACIYLIASHENLKEPIVFNSLRLWSISLIAVLFIIYIGRKLLNKHKQKTQKPEHTPDNAGILNTIKTNDILIIGGPKEAKCYFEEGIKHVPCDPINVLKLDRHLYDYDIVIFWPTVCSINDYELNITKGELFKVVPRAYFDRYNYYSIYQRGIDKYVIMLMKRFDSLMALYVDNVIKDFGRRSLRQDIQLSMNKNSQIDVARYFNKEEYIICGGSEHSRYDLLVTDADNAFRDNLEMVDDNDKRNVYAWYKEKLCEILLGIANKQLAFVVCPTNKDCNKNHDIFSWIPFDIKFDYDPVNNVSINKSSAVNPHPIQTIMEGLEPIIREWASHIDIIAASACPYRLLILGSSNKLLMKIRGYKSKAFRGYQSNLEREDTFLDDGISALSICEGHTDGRGDVRSLMMLSNTGGLAVIPEPKSIDDLVGIIQKSFKKTPIAPAALVDLANSQQTQSAEKDGLANIPKPQTIDDIAGIVQELLLKKTTPAPSDLGDITNVQPPQATEKPFLSMFNVRPDTFKWEDVVVAYNPDTKRIGFIYSGRPSSQYYINELPGIGSKKQNDKLTQPGELLHNILANKHRFYEIKEIASILEISPSSVKQVVHGLNKALIKLFFCSAEDIPAMTHSKEADSYTVGFTIMDQWSSARKEESDEHDRTSDEPDLDQDEKDKYDVDYGSDAIPARDK